MRFLVTGAGGQIGSEVVSVLHQRAAAAQRGSRWRIVAQSHDDLDVGNRDAVLGQVITAEPDVIIHTAAWTAVDACESDAERAFRVNALGTRNLGEAARLVGAHVCYISTDYVFDGDAGRPYVEWDEPNPLSVYGRSKLGGERELDPSATIVRTSWVFGRTGHNMVKTLLKVARPKVEGHPGEGPVPEHHKLSFVADQHGSPTSAADVASKVVDLAVSRRPGTFHVTNQGTTTWYEFAREVLRLAGDDPDRVEPIATKDLDPPRPAARPAYSVLDNAALRLAGDELLPPWEVSLERVVSELLRG